MCYGSSLKKRERERERGGEGETRGNGNRRVVSDWEGCGSNSKNLSCLQVARPFAALIVGRMRVTIRATKFWGC